MAGLARLIPALIPILAAGLMLGAAASPAAAQPVGPVTSADMSLGDPRAKVTVIEYASASCPHCARFNNEVFPAFKAKYVDTGKVRYVFREFLTPPPELALAVFLEARCAGPGKYFSAIDQAFHAQTHIYETGDWHTSLYAIGRSVGLDEARLTACLSDKAAADAMQARIEGYAREDKIDSTPTFVIGTRRLTGEQSLSSLDAAIAEARSGGGR
jgi:protein-disulfide isomerase